jgi:hypothetical protein
MAIEIHIVKISRKQAKIEAAKENLSIILENKDRED